MNQITALKPTTWQQLEETVCDILAECGMRAERQVHVSLLRGGADIDVVASDVREGITTKIVCECKYWETAVPQTVIHSFRTVMAEIGAHRGYVISKAGFQSGAYEAAHATNIELLTFAEFQAHFFERWLGARLEALEDSISNFSVYYEPFGIPGMGLLTDEAEQDAYYKVWQKHLGIGLILPFFSPYMRRLGKGTPLPPLPLASPNLKGEVFALPSNVASAKGYRELFASIEEHALEGLTELRGRNPITRGRQPHEVYSDD